MPVSQKRYSVQEAANDMGIDRATLERFLRTGDKTFGFYVPPTEGNKRGIYVLFKERVEAYINAHDLKGCQYIKTVASGKPIDINKEERRQEK